MKQTEKQTLGEKTAQNLLEMIQQKEYAPGDKLPTEAELVETLGVGRNTVREALRILMSRNIVTIRQGSGTFISEIFAVMLCSLQLWYFSVILFHLSINLYLIQL